MVLINSNGQRGVVMGDVLHTIAQVSEPAWCAGVDTDKEQSAASRGRLLDASEEGDWTICRRPLPAGQADWQNRPRGRQAGLATAIRMADTPPQGRITIRSCATPIPIP